MSIRKGFTIFGADRFRLSMGIAWFDDDAPPELEPELRTGGRPLLPRDATWPCCPQCDQPMLFRGQIPLALTSLVPYDDERLVLLFECHLRRDGDACTGTAAITVQGDLELKNAPPPTSFDVWLLETGARPGEIARVLEALDAEPSAELPYPVLRLVPSSIAQGAVEALHEAGAKARLRPSAPALLAGVFGGSLVPFDDGTPGTRKTTLPPLRELMSELGRVPMRGIFGGATPGYRDHAFICACGSETRTAVRLLAHERPDGSSVTLGPATLQYCNDCGETTLLRVGGQRKPVRVPLSLVPPARS